MAEQQPDKAAWSVRNWCDALDLSQAYAYELMGAGKVNSVKVGRKRLITTAPKDFVASLANKVAA